MEKHASRYRIIIKIPGVSARDYEKLNLIAIKTVNEILEQTGIEATAAFHGDAFYRQKRSLSSQKWAGKNKEKVQEYKKKWKQKNKEKVREYKQKYYQENKEKVREYNRIYQAKRRADLKNKEKEVV